MFDRINLGHREGHSKTHDGYRKRFHCCFLEDLRVWGDWRLVPETVQVCQIIVPLNMDTLRWISHK